jgi:hypothetical protein
VVPWPRLPGAVRSTQRPLCGRSGVKSSVIAKCRPSRQTPGGSNAGLDDGRNPGR